MTSAVLTLPPWFRWGPSRHNFASCRLSHVFTAVWTSSSSNKRWHLKCSFNFGKREKSERDKPGMSGCWSKAVKPMVWIPGFFVPTREASPLTSAVEESLLHFRASSSSRCLQFFRGCNVLLRVKNRGSRYTLQTQHTSIPDSSKDKVLPLSKSPRKHLPLSNDLPTSYAVKNTTAARGLFRNGIVASYTAFPKQ
jgi:hypothetical protein